MSQERTEKATPKRKEKAREEGQVAKSRELTSALSLLFILLFLLMMVPIGFKYFQTYLAASLSRDFVEVFNSEGIQSQVIESISVYAITALPVLLFAALIGFCGEIIQVGFLFTAKLIAPKLDKLNPLKGFKRIFSKRSLVEMVKSILKAVLLIYIAYNMLKGELETITILGQFPLNEALGYVGTLIVKIGVTVAIFQLVVGGLDYAYQWWEHDKSIRMTKREVLDEFKEMEGDPHIQGKIKERRRILLQRRMMQEVPKADVIITNPTHLAIALKYEAEKGTAPMVVAKGSDELAKRIIALAKEHRIQIVENKPLARTLYDTTEIGSEIPVDLYQAVAEVLAFVYRLKKVYS